MLELKDIMNDSNVVILGNTIKEDKYAHKIKLNLINNGYNVECIPYELKSINEVTFNEFTLDICINSFKAIELIKEANVNIKQAIIQPGAESEELFKLLNEKNIPYLEACMLVGLKLYKGAKIK